MSPLRVAPRVREQPEALGLRRDGRRRAAAGLTAAWTSKVVASVAQPIPQARHESEALLALELLGSKDAVARDPLGVLRAPRGVVHPARLIVRMDEASQCMAVDGTCRKAGAIKVLKQFAAVWTCLSRTGRPE